MLISGLRTLALGALAGCAVSVVSAAPAQAFSATFRWCSGTPEFRMKQVPKGTARLTFRMVDLWVPNYPHGGGEIAYKGQATIPCGSLSGSYAPPSPPPPQVHDYEWTITALDGSGKTLGTTKVTRKFPER